MARKHRPIESGDDMICPYCKKPLLIAIPCNETKIGLCYRCNEHFYYECEVKYKTCRMTDLTKAEKRKLKGE